MAYVYNPRTMAACKSMARAESRQDNELFSGRQVHDTTMNALQRKREEMLKKLKAARSAQVQDSALILRLQIILANMLCTDLRNQLMLANSAQNKDLALIKVLESKLRALEPLVLKSATQSNDLTLINPLADAIAKVMAKTR